MAMSCLAHGFEKQEAQDRIGARYTGNRQQTIRVWQQAAEHPIRAWLAMRGSNATMWHHVQQEDARREIEEVGEDRAGKRLA